MRMVSITTMVFALAAGLSACGKDDKDGAARDAEIQKKLHEGMQREKQMYEGMRKGVEDLEKQSPQQKRQKTQ